MLWGELGTAPGVRAAPRESWGVPSNALSSSRAAQGVMGTKGTEKGQVCVRAPALLRDSELNNTRISAQAGTCPRAG